MAMDIWLAALSAPTDVQHAESSAASSLLKRIKRQAVERIFAHSGQFTVRGAGVAIERLAEVFIGPSFASQENEVQSWTMAVPPDRYAATSRWTSSKAFALQKPLKFMLTRH